MKNIAALIFALFFLTIQPALANDKYALVITISEYNEETGWNKINSGNDAELIKNALILQGFSEDNIFLFGDGDELTKDRILELFKEKLIHNVEEGDVVFFHYSGHGQQIADDNGDELDGLDEALVPINAPKLNYILDEVTGEKIPYNGELHLRDDELGEVLENLRRKLGPAGNVMVSIDACHSGTATRGIGVGRGTKDPNVPDDWEPPTIDINEHNAKVGFGLHTVDKDLASMVSFFGSGQHEINYEYIDYETNTNYGSLSYALSKALSEADNNTSYRVLFEKVKNIMATIATRQTPQVEGDLDQEIMGGKLLGATNYFTVKNWYNNEFVEINGGALQSLTKGSLVAFYPSDTREIENVTPLASGIVEDSQIYQSRVKITEGNLDRDAAIESWVYITETNYSENTIYVKVNVGDDKINESIKNELSKHAIITLTEEDNVDILIEIESEESSRGVNLRAITFDDLEVYNEPFINSDNQIHQRQLMDITKSIYRFAQARFLRQLEHYNPRMQADISIIPLELVTAGIPYNPRSSDFIELDPKSLINEAGQMVIKDGTYIKVKVRNHSPRTIYYTLMDISPDNEIFIIYPDEYNSPSEFVLKGFSETEHTAIFQIGEPYGTDILKLIVSDQPLNLSLVVQTRGQDGGGNSPLEKLLQGTYETNGTRGPSRQNVSTENIGIYTFSYQITP